MTGKNEVAANMTENATFFHIYISCIFFHYEHFRKINIQFEIIDLVNFIKQYKTLFYTTTIYKSKEL